MRFSGFKSKDEVLHEFRTAYMEKHLKAQRGPTVEEFQFYVDAQEETRYRK